MTDTTMRAPAPVHPVAVVSDGFEFLAECGCGWASDWHPRPQDADEAGAEHRDTAVGPPDAMDVLMSGLLDLQDDLAATVVWLAENWSADLPAPALLSTTHYDDTGEPVAGVSLLAGTTDSVELVRVADRLGVPVLTDERPDTQGNRYQRAARRFGRVEVEVIRSVGDEQ
jgi:hypothetical protein